MIPATPEEQRQLLALQHFDTTIRQLQVRRASLPEQKALDENTETLRSVSAEHVKATEDLAAAERQQSRLESEVAAVNSRRKSEEGRMYSGLITSEKELEALRGELSSLRARKHDLEDAQLEAMERVEDLTGLVAMLAERRSELSGRTAALTSARDEAAAEIDRDLAERRGERAQAAAAVDGEILSLYDDLRARKNGIAVAALEGRTCAGCRLDLTATELEEARERVAKGLARCPQCDRILVLP